MFGQRTSLVPALRVVYDGAATPAVFQRTMFDVVPVRTISGVATLLLPMVIAPVGDSDSSSFSVELPASSQYQKNLFDAERVSIRNQASSGSPPDLSGMPRSVMTPTLKMASLAFVVV